MTTPIGVFDSGFGGLTVLKEIVRALPDRDFVYLGDNARAPYGNRSFEVVYRYTLEAVRWLFDRGCPLVVIACNTASAKALRSIQQRDLPQIDPARRILGVLRPVVETVGALTKTRHVGVFGTLGTVQSQSYVIEINKFFPDVVVEQEACPMWVPLVENAEFAAVGADYYVKQHIDRLIARDGTIDTVILGCTHYPLLYEKIRKFLPHGISIVSQAEIVAKSLVDYLRRHPDLDARCTRDGGREFFTSENPENFDRLAGLFFGESVLSNHASFDCT
jgi:glutamate racemase